MNLKDCIFIYGEEMGSIRPATYWSAPEVAVLKERYRVYPFTELAKLIRQNAHLIFCYLLPHQVKSLFKEVKDRRNFSMIIDDWWDQPFEITILADNLIFRKNHGVMVRRGLLPFMGPDEPPYFTWNPGGLYAKFASIARVYCSGFHYYGEGFQTVLRKQVAAKQRIFHLPYSSDFAADVPIRELVPKHEFLQTHAIVGIWPMRDPFATERYGFANLYYDRLKLANGVNQWQGSFSICDNRRDPVRIPYPEYMQRCQQSKFVIATGGLHQAAVPKFMEHIATATPIFGMDIPGEMPWLKDCTFRVNALRLNGGQIRKAMQDAIDDYPRLKQNCENHREKIIREYRFDQLITKLERQVYEC